MYVKTNSGKLLTDELIDWLVNETGSKKINSICLYITSIHQMEQKLSFYLMLMIVFIDMHPNLLENGCGKSRE